MTFDEIKAEVLAIVKRPDLEAQVISAIQAATLKAHTSDFYYQDLIERAIEFDAERYVQNFQPSDVLPNFRQAKYIRLWLDPTEYSPGPFFKHIHVENAIDRYSYEKTDVFYMSGTLLQIRSTCPTKYVLFGAYVHPTVAPVENYSSWIAERYPWAIVYEAARSVFLTTGYQEQSANMRALVQEQYGILAMSGVDSPPT